MAQGETIRLGPWPSGMNNRQEDYALPEGTLRNAVNIDIDNQGRLRRRAGYEKIVLAAKAHSGYACPAGAFFVDAGVLKQVDGDGNTVDVCAVSGDVMAYEYFDGVLYFSDGRNAYKRLPNGRVLPWGFDVPGEPALDATPHGQIPPGVYLAATTYVTHDGIEHGASTYGKVTLSNAGAIRFFNLPQRGDAVMRLYLSTTNGVTLYQVGETTSGSFTVTANAGSGKPLSTVHLRRPPAGHILRVFNGRMYVADGRVRWHSEPFAFEHFDLGANFVQYEDDIAVMEPTPPGGMWIATARKTFFLSASVDDPGQREVAGYGAVPGTSLVDPEGKRAMWYSQRGVVIGNADGSLVNMQEANVAAHTGVSGAAMLREENGNKQFVASVAGAKVPPLAASTFIEMEVIRKVGR